MDDTQRDLAQLRDGVDWEDQVIPAGRDLNALRQAAQRAAGLQASSFEERLGAEVAAGRPFARANGVHHCCADLAHGKRLERGGETGQHCPAGRGALLIERLPPQRGHFFRMTARCLRVES